MFSAVILFEMDEKKTIRRLKEGKQSALRQLMVQYQDYVYSVALRMVRDKRLAEEITQDVFLKVFQKIDSFKETAKFSTWLFTIVYRTSLNYLEKKQIVQTESSLTESGDNSSIFEKADAGGIGGQALPDDSMDLQSVLWKAIDRLNHQQGVVISLFYLQQFSIEEIARIMQMPANSIKTHLFRGRSNLRSILSREYTLEDLI